MSSARRLAILVLVGGVALGVIEHDQSIRRSAAAPVSLPAYNGQVAVSSVPGLNVAAPPPMRLRQISIVQRTRTPSVAASGGRRAFISSLLPGARAGQRRYGVPTSVTIAQAIDESDWGRAQSAQYNVFGVKGDGPDGSTIVPTEEYIGDGYVTIYAPFRRYNSLWQAIMDHDCLLATQKVYAVAMAHRSNPNAFANDLTGVYATDPYYGPKLIGLMKQYDLYRFDTPFRHSAVRANSEHRPHGNTIPGLSDGGWNAEPTDIPGL